MGLATKGTTAAVEVRRGVPTLLIDGEPAAPVWYLPSAPEYTAVQDVLEMRRAAAHGVKIYVIPYSPHDYGDREAFVSRLRADILTKTALSEIPDALLVLRISCDMASEALTGDDSQAVVYNGGEAANIASLASDLWVERVKTMLRSIVEHVQSDELLNARVIGYELLGSSCEWFGPGYWEGLLDTSEPNRLGFVRYLKRLYKTDGALRAAWDDPAVTLETAPLPAYDKLPGVYNEPAQKANVDEGQTLLLDPRNRKYVDFLDYGNEQRSEQQAAFAKVIKDACNREKLTITYYGYHADCYTASSNHFGTARLLQSPDIDVLSGPVGYQDRCEGGIGAFMGMADAVTAAGKLWMDEGDYRSPLHTATDGLPYPPTTGLLDQTIRREMGKCMIYDAGVWWLSFNKGWFDYDSFWEITEDLTRKLTAYQAFKTRTTPEICYVLDESAMSLAGDANATGLQLIRFGRTVCYRSGYRFGMYLLEDLLAGHIDDAKVYVFVDPWRLDGEKARRVAGKVRRPGKTTLYMYGNGATDARDFYAMTGLSLHQRKADKGYTPVFTLADGLEPGLADATHRADLPHGITEALADLALTEVNPVYAAAPGEGVTALGRYAGGPADGEAGFASCSRDGWTSVFYGGMKLSPELFDYVARLGGAHAYADRGDVLHADDHLLMLHVSDPGTKTVRFPRVCDIYSLEEKRWTTGDTYTVSDAYRGQTILLLYGDRELLEAQLDWDWESKREKE